MLSRTHVHVLSYTCVYEACKPREVPGALPGSIKFIEYISFLDTREEIEFMIISLFSRPHKGRNRDAVSLLSKVGKGRIGKETQ